MFDLLDTRSIITNRLDITQEIISRTEHKTLNLINLSWFETTKKIPINSTESISTE